MSCNFVYKNGKLAEVRADNGSPSLLFNEAKNKFGEEVAKDIFLASKSEQFQSIFKANREISNIEDVNGEPILSEVTKFLAHQNKSKEKLTKPQMADMINFMASVGTRTSEELKAQLKNAFYNNDGMFIVDENKLVNSGLYTRGEARLISEINYDQVKQTVEALENTEVDITVAPFDDVSFNYDITLFGKLKGQETQPEIQANTEVLDNELNTVPDNNTKQKLLVASKEVTDGNIAERINKIINYSDTVINQNLDLVNESLKDISNDLVEYGIDVQGLSADENLKPFLAVLRDFISNPNTQNLEAFSEAYNRNFNIPSTPKKVATANDKKYYVVDDSTLTEQEIFERESLVKHAKNLYYKVRREDIDTLLDKLKLSESRLALETEAMTQNGFNDVDVALEVLLYKKAFNSPTRVVVEEQVEVSNFTGNFEYLSNDYVADFHSKMIKERVKNSEMWNNFYSLFDINDKGLYLKNNDSYSLALVELYADENLRQYSLISKQLPNLKVEEQDVNIVQQERDYITNNKYKLPQYRGNSYIIDNDNFIVKGAKDRFIKVGENIFEAIQVDGELSLYSKIQEESSNYYQVNVQAPTPNINLKDFSDLKTNPEKFVKVNNWKNKTEKDKLKENSFDCL